MSVTLDGVRVPGCGPGTFGWSQRRVDGAEVICLAGELDLAVAADLHSRLMGITESGTAAVLVLDLSDVRFIDAACAGVIVTAWDCAGRHGGRLEVAGLHGNPALVFHLLGLEPILARRTESSDGGRDADERDGRARGIARRRFA